MLVCLLIHRNAATHLYICRFYFAFFFILGKTILFCRFYFLYIIYLFFRSSVTVVSRNSISFFLLPRTYLKINRRTGLLGSILGDIDCFFLPLCIISFFFSIKKKGFFLVGEYTHTGLNMCCVYILHSTYNHVKHSKCPIC